MCCVLLQHSGLYHHCISNCSWIHIHTHTQRCKYSNWHLITMNEAYCLLCFLWFYKLDQRRLEMIAYFLKEIFVICLNLLPAGLLVALPCRYCFYSLAQKWVFCPAGATRCGGPLPRANFHVYWDVGIQPPKLSIFRIFARNLYLRGNSFAIFLGNSQCLYASIGSF